MAKPDVSFSLDSFAWEARQGIPRYEQHGAAVAPPRALTANLTQEAQALSDLNQIFAAHPSIEASIDRQIDAYIDKLQRKYRIRSLLIAMLAFWAGIGVALAFALHLLP